MKKICLAIETSCDETAVAIVDSHKNILANIIKSQIDLHKIYGGVVPEIAARAHLDIIAPLVLSALNEVKLNLSDIDFFSATCGPGLVGGLIVGITVAKTLSSLASKPFVAVNHLVGHALTAQLTHSVSFPYLLLLISGGHCQILLVENIDNFILLGQTIDDSLGECFDKVAKMLNLAYPGGPIIEKHAKNGNKNAFKFALPLISKKNHQHLYDFSFSGLKTAVRLQIEKLQPLTAQNICDISASFQGAVVKIMLNRLQNVLQHPKILSLLANKSLSQIVLAGGVAANQYILGSLQQWAENYQLNVIAPPISLCTDNAVMIAWAGLQKFLHGKVDNLSFAVKPRWPLSDCI